MKPELGPVIAYRKYFSRRDASRATLIEVEIAAPAESPHREDEFMCSFRVKWSTSDRVETVYGIDTLQALLLALGYLETILRGLESSLDLSLCWTGGEAQDFGIRIPNFSDKQPL